MATNTSLPMVRQQFLSTSSGAVASGQSFGTAVQQNTVRVEATLLGADGVGVAVSVFLEGSYDGRTWLDLSSVGLLVSLSAPAPAVAVSSDPIRVDCSYVRCRYELEGSDASVVISASVVFSMQ